ncbi:TPA: hypothetical protein ACH3X3_011917 [Trebouxia sp. C0006]
MLVSSMEPQLGPLQGPPSGTVSEATDRSLRFKRKSDAQVNNKCRCLPSESRSWSRPATATGVFCNTYHRQPPTSKKGSCQPDLDQLAAGRLWKYDGLISVPYFQGLSAAHVRCGQTLAS